MTLATKIFGSETRLRPLVKSLALLTVLRAGWFAINANFFSGVLFAWALIPWPQPWFLFSVWAVDVVLAAFQLRASVRLGRLLLLRFAPEFAAFLGLSAGPAAEEHPLTPRNRSWWPTALLLCGLLILTSCALPWVVLMIAAQQWVPFQMFMTSEVAGRAAFVGVVLSALGLLFGGRYIARAATDVTTSFGVMTVDQSHWLTERVHGLADRLDLPRPAVGVTDILNAFAMGANQKSSMVVIGKPLFDYERDELDAIIGHELGHILHNDVARMSFAEGFQRLLVNVVNVLTVIGAIAAAANSKRRSDARRNVQLALGSGRIVRKTVFVASELVAKGISRNREYHADAVGAHLTSPDAMARALKRVHGVADKPTAQERHYGYLMFRGAAFGNLFATHPPLKARLKALDTRIALPGGGIAPATGLQPATPGASMSARLVDQSVRHGAMAYGIGRKVRRAFVAVRGTASAKRLATFGAVCVLLALVAPAVVSFYGLEQRFSDVKASTGQAITSSWNWAVNTKEAWLGVSEYTTRARQIDAREQAVKSAEARLTADRNALAQQTSAGNSNLAGALAERDQARRQVQDLLLKLDGANADRATLTARLSLQTPPDSSDLQRQVASLTGQLSAVTADRDEMVRRNDELRQMNLELKGQVANRDMARVDLDKQIHAFQDQIANLANGQPPDEEEPVEPVVPQQPSTTAGGYGAFAVAANGILILTDRSYPSGQAASDAAIAECNRLSKGSRCDVQQVFQNTCAAVARVAPVTRKSPYRLQLEATVRDAEEMALSECYHRNRQQPCEVTRQVCVP